VNEEAKAHWGAVTPGEKEICVIYREVREKAQYLGR